MVRRNTIQLGDCINLMQRLPDGSVDFILTDPPYLVGYRNRSGRSVANDTNPSWLEPAYAEMYRVVKPDAFMVSFYGWNKADKFIAAWRNAGFRLVEHIVFLKSYASSERFMRREHESAYLLAKGDPALPERALPDVLPWEYTGNRLHPTQKPVASMERLVQAFSRPGDLVLDPFCGAGSSLVAARRQGRDFLGIELDAKYRLMAALRTNSE